MRKLQRRLAKLRPKLKGIIHIYNAMQYILCCSCRLHEEIMAVGGARLKPQQEMVDKLVKEIDSANTTITKATVGIKTNER